MGGHPLLPLKKNFGGRSLPGSAWVGGRLIAFFQIEFRGNGRGRKRREKGEHE